jgi:hypothetical protein
VQVSFWFNTTCDYNPTWTQLVDLGATLARIELVPVHLFAVGVHDERRHDLLLLLVGAGDIEDDLLGGAIELNVQLVDLDVGCAI